MTATGRSRPMRGRFFHAHDRFVTLLRGALSGTGQRLAADLAAALRRLDPLRACVAHSAIDPVNGSTGNARRAGAAPRSRTPVVARRASPTVAAGDAPGKHVLRSRTSPTACTSPSPTRRYCGPQLGRRPTRRYDLRHGSARPRVATMHRKLCTTSMPVASPACATELHTPPASSVEPTVTASCSVRPRHCAIKVMSDRHSIAWGGSAAEEKAKSHCHESIGWTALASLSTTIASSSSLRDYAPETPTQGVAGAALGRCRASRWRAVPQLAARRSDVERTSTEVAVLLTRSPPVRRELPRFTQ